MNEEIFEEDIYSEEFLVELLDDDSISSEEYGFMLGYLEVEEGEQFV
jgi:hypothetical protein